MRFPAYFVAALGFTLAAGAAHADPMDDVGSFFHDMTHIGDPSPQRELPPVEGTRKDQLITVVGDGFSKTDGEGQVTVDESTNDVSYAKPGAVPAVKPPVKPESKAAAPLTPQPRAAAAVKAEPQTDTWDDFVGLFGSETPEKPAAAK